MTLAVAFAMALASISTPAYADQGIAFAPGPENATLDCGTLVVPVDYRKPFGERVGIAVIRAKATNPARRIGVVVGNPGGPGVSGVDFVLGGINVPAFARLRERFDIVSFDPRGVSRSRAVHCVAQYPDPPADPDTADDATLAAYFDEVGRVFAKACVEQNGLSWVTHLGTNNVARDIDRRIIATTSSSSSRSFPVRSSGASSGWIKSAGAMRRVDWHRSAWWRRSTRLRRI